MSRVALTALSTAIALLVAAILVDNVWLWSRRRQAIPARARTERP